MEYYIILINLLVCQTIYNNIYRISIDAITENIPEKEKQVNVMLFVYNNSN